MGLDMFLMLDKGRKGPSQIEKIWNSDEYWNKVARLKNGEFDGLKLAQWRKAFGILNWFDHNLASVPIVNRNLSEEELLREGVQYDHYYKVTKEEIENLIAVCEKMNEIGKDRLNETDIPDDLKPIGKGFFIGATNEVDDFWWDDIDITVFMLKEVGKFIDWNEDDAYFCIG